MRVCFRECCLKLGEKLGNDLWNAVNNAFDTMPIAATVDGKVSSCLGVFTDNNYELVYERYFVVMEVFHLLGFVQSFRL